MKPQTRPRTGFDIDAMIANAHEASAFLKALAHEARLVILCLLAEQELSVTEIEEVLALRQPAISQQLARLRADGLVDARRDGKNIYYSLGRTETREVISALHRAFCAEPSRRVRQRRKPPLMRAAAQAKLAGRKVQTTARRRPAR